jgi:hypothetical protein
MIVSPQSDQAAHCIDGSSPPCTLVGLQRVAGIFTHFPEWLPCLTLCTKERLLTLFWMIQRVPTSVLYSTA